MSTAVFEKIKHVREWAADVRREGGKIGFIPTMGALHRGHISLINRAKEENDHVVASIFVNPTQFNNPDDLLKYPRTFELDLAMLEDAGCDALFYPSVKEIYPKPEKNHWDFGMLSNSLEGAFRPGHFDGVLTVVKKLLEIVEADGAYFGEKDFQQLALIRKMAEFENIPTRIIGCPSVREKDGLAMSSRNMRLDKESRANAVAISRILFDLREKMDRFQPQELAAEGMTMLKKSTGIQPEYLAVVDSETLEPIEQWLDNREAVILVAAYVGDVRLIDNVILNKNAN